jgi:hypothetical protein
LADARDALAGTRLENVLSADDAQQIVAEVDRIEAHLAELDGQIRCYGLDPVELAHRCQQLEQRGASPQAVAAARLQADGARRLCELRDRQARGLQELADLVELLRTQLLLARLGSATGADESASSERIGDLKSELWARLEGLTALSPSAPLVDP